MSRAAALFNPGELFERHYPDVTYVTVTSVDPDTGATLAEAEGVPAAKLRQAADTVGARTGEVGVTSCEWWFRSDLLGFTPKPRDLLTADPGGENEAVWILDDAKFTGVGGVNHLCQSMATKKR